jgi:hypothetical protein
MVAPMNRRSLSAQALVMTTPVFLCACLAPEAGAGVEVDADGLPPALGSAGEESRTVNALTANALTANALTANALTANALTANALTAAALTANALTASALEDPNARSLLGYVVGCALPSGTDLAITVAGATYRYHGQIGLAPDWGKHDGHCDSACRAWVSGCVLSRLNHLGQSVPISIRGGKSQLSSSSSERQTYPHREATYYGDIFATSQLLYGCLSPGATSDPRVCGHDLDSCVVSFVGACDEACDGVKSDGSFPNCRDASRDAHGHFPPGTKAFLGSVTVFLH